MEKIEILTGNFNQDGSKNHLLVNIACAICQSRTHSVIVKEISNGKYLCNCSRCKLDYITEVKLSQDFTSTVSDNMYYGNLYITFDTIFKLIYDPTRFESGDQEELERHRSLCRSIAARVITTVRHEYSNLNIKGIINPEDYVTVTSNRTDKLGNEIFEFKSGMTILWLDENGNYHSFFYKNKLIKHEDLELFRQYNDTIECSIDIHTILTRYINNPEETVKVIKFALNLDL